MSDMTDELSERDEIEALLPWYISGGLDAKTRARVDRYMDAHPEARSHLALAREELDAIVAGNEAIAGPGPEALARLRASIAATAPRRRSSLAQLSERLANWIGGPSPPQLGFAAAIAALILVLQAAAIGALVMERVSAPTYQTASGEQTAVEGIEFLVGFSEEASMGEISGLLKKVGAILVDGPRAGLYRVRLPAAGEAGREAAREALQQSGVVTSILPGQ